MGVIDLKLKAGEETLLGGGFVGWGKFGVTIVDSSCGWKTLELDCKSGDPKFDNENPLLADDTIKLEREQF